MTERNFKTLSALRIYLKRGDNRKAKRWWARAFEKPLSTHLVHSALKAGITHASVNLGHMGFAKDAKAVAHDISDVPLSTLPVCVELLGPKRLLEQFVRDQARHLKETTLLMVDGIHISSALMAEVDTAIQSDPHRVEYLKGGEVDLPIERVGLMDEVSAGLPLHRPGKESAKSAPAEMRQ